MKVVWIFLCYLCVFVVLPTQISEYLPPPRPALVAVHWPDLSQLEPDVRDQIKSQQEILVSTVKDTQSTETKLSAAYGAMGEIYHAYSLNAPARECYLNAHTLAPKDFRWVYLLAKLDQLEGRVDDAIRRYRTITSLRPDLVAALVNLGNIYLELDRLEDARSNFATALQKEPNSPAARYGLGQVALSRRNYAEAVEHFEKALGLAPDANRLHYALGMAYRGLRNAEKAKLHLAQQGSVGVRVADPLIDRLVQLVEGARLHLIRGKLALEAKRYEEAAAEFRKAIEARPDSVPAHINLGAALTQLGDLKGAAEEFRKALVIDPNNANAHYNLAILLANEKQHQQAIVHLQAVSTISPNDYGARFFLAQQLLQAKRAEEALKLAQSLYSTTRALQHGALVGLALAELGRCDEAAEWQRKLIARAVEERNDELQLKLKADLRRYESCRQ
jgi:tetratricopeptide (TPR) repeat protein